MSEYLVSNISYKETKKVEALGKECLPIYYQHFDLMGMILDPYHFLFKVHQKGDQTKTPVGFIVAEMMANGRLHIKSLGVSPKHRRKGLAKQLVNHLKNPDFVKRLTLYVLVDNQPALSLYEGLGFRQVKRMPKYYENLGKDAFYYSFEKS